VHEFESTEHGTQMTDSFEFEAPVGPLGRLVEVLVLTRHMTRFLERRNATLRELAETNRIAPPTVG
jgi:ligand-binding SRPBCC domain-containing protein